MSDARPPEAAAAPAWWRRRAVRWIGMPLTVVLGALLGLMTWPIHDIVPSAGLDPSWRGALHMAAHEGMNFGSEIVFTFGPLGFLTVPELYYSPTAALGLLFTGGIHFTLTTTLVHLGRTSRPVWLGLAGAILAASVLDPLTVLGHAPGVLAFLWSVHVLRPNAGGRTVAWFPLVAGVGAGFIMLVKFNTGLMVLAVTGITVLALALRRGGRWTGIASPIPLFLAGALASFLVMWLGTGQVLADIPAFVAGSIAIAGGYSSAMGLEETGREWEYFAAAVAIGGLFAVALSATSAWPRYDRLAALAIASAVTFLAFKHGFVRHDGHAIGIFGLALIGLQPFGGARLTRRLTASVVVLLLYLLSSGLSPLQLIDPVARVGDFAKQLDTMTSAPARFVLKEQARAAMRDDYGIDARALDLLKGHSVAIDPWEANVAWAYPDTFRWAPLPVFQSYSAYTAYLDDLNAGRLLSEQAPERLLRQKQKGLDGRNEFFESPATSLAIVCRYQQLYADRDWQVLGRSRNRCGAPRLIASRTADLGELVAVPHGERNELVYAEVIGVRDGLLEKVRAFLYKSGEVRIGLEGIGGYRLVPETASNPLIMDVPPQYSYNSAGFEWRARTDAFTITYVDTLESSDQLVVNFFAVAVSP